MLPTDELHADGAIDDVASRLRVTVTSVVADAVAGSAVRTAAAAPRRAAAACVGRGGGLRADRSVVHLPAPAGGGTLAAVVCGAGGGAVGAARPSGHAVREQPAGHRGGDRAGDRCVAALRRAGQLPAGAPGRAAGVGDRRHRRGGATTRGRPRRAATGHNYGGAAGRSAVGTSSPRLSGGDGGGGWRRRPASSLPNRAPLGCALCAGWLAGCVHRRADSLGARGY